MLAVLSHDREKVGVRIGSQGRDCVAKAIEQETVRTRRPSRAEVLIGLGRLA